MAVGWSCGPFSGTPAQVTALVNAFVVTGDHASHWSIAQTFLVSELALLKVGSQCRLFATGQNGSEGGKTQSGAGTRRQMDYQLDGVLA